MDPTENTLVVAYLNCRGQTGFSESKQLQIESFIKCYNIDILHLQESNVEDSTFSQCKFIISNFNIIQNNSPSKYGTASIVKSSLPIEDIILHQSGRIILFNVGSITFGNVYLPSGTDGPSRNSRENFCGETIPNLMVNSKNAGMIGGDWNNIIARDDCTRHPDAKMSPCVKRVVNTFSWVDTFRYLHPNTRNFSHYYGNTRIGEGATRIDRSYSFGNITPIEAKYVSVALSDHLSYIVKINLPAPLSTVLCP
jgi:exonuclease III